MPDFRCFFDSDDASIDQMELNAEESLHLVSANRAREGDPVVAFNGKGLEWNCRLRTPSKRASVLQVESQKTLPSLPYEIALAQAIPKGKSFESIIRKATEIGVSKIYPIITERTEFKLKTDRKETKNSKWRTAAIEGAKQSGNPFVPEIAIASPLIEFLNGAYQDYDLGLIACLRDGSSSIRQIFQKLENPPKRVVWFVGPEGDFTKTETDRLLDSGCRPATLGPYVMRCETAATAALGALANELSMI